MHTVRGDFVNQAGFRTRHIMPVAINAVCRNVTHSAKLQALTKYELLNLVIVTLFQFSSFINIRRMFDESKQ